MTKHHSITNLVELIFNKFGSNAPIIMDHWEGDLYAIGLEKNNKLIYISTYELKPNHYFYECEILTNDTQKPYLVDSTEDDITEERLLKVMSKFFEIEFIGKKQ